MDPRKMSEIAREIGMSQPSMSRAVKVGRCPTIMVEGERRVDRDDPRVQRFIDEAHDNVVRAHGNPRARIEVERRLGATDQTFRVRGRVGPRKADGSPPDPPRRPPRADSDSSSDLSPSDMYDELAEAKLRKAKADAELAEAKLRTTTEEYLERLGAVVDLETLRRKIGHFRDSLTNSLLYLPEDISEMLWLQARAADDGAAVIREELTRRIASIIREAKKAADDIARPHNGRRYAVIDDDG